ncbi:hypothetical protein RchiOBHm_Chr5g0054521 [Rosa chinensis]|uniref:Uncharacterized protein n=1 Tax=Rosa chinensis TaxID=74649 RepID=A0A2P6QG72_ROSCH|nr:hypothetical protein RchiOBHm_Chr5g0054521 [Rosa chinensis]
MQLSRNLSVTPRNVKPSPWTCGTLKSEFDKKSLHTRKIPSNVRIDHMLLDFGSKVAPGVCDWSIRSESYSPQVLGCPLLGEVMPKFLVKLL